MFYTTQRYLPMYNLNLNGNDPADKEIYSRLVSQALWDLQHLLNAERC